MEGNELDRAHSVRLTIPENEAPTALLRTATATHALMGRPPRFPCATKYGIEAKEAETRAEAYRELLETVISDAVLVSDLTLLSHLDTSRLFS